MVFLRKLTFFVLSAFDSAKAPALHTKFRQIKDLGNFSETAPSSADWNTTRVFQRQLRRGGYLQVVMQGFIFDAQMKFLFLCVMLLFQINGTMLEKSDFFEDRQAVSATFCLWCNSVLNSLKSVQKFNISVGVDAHIDLLHCTKVILCLKA